MTELKKLTALSQEVEELAKLLNPSSTSLETDSASNSVLPIRQLQEKSENRKRIPPNVEKIGSRESARC